MNTGTEIVPVNRIEQALRKENITEQVIAQLKTDYLGLVVKDENDKEGHAKVRAARLHCKELRVLATKIAKAGREEAIKEQRDWIAAEKHVTSQIGEVETYLESQEEIVAGAEKRRKEAEAEAERKAQEDRERLAREKVQNRISSMAQFGVPMTWEAAAAMPDSVFDGHLKTAERLFEEAKEQKRKDDERRAEEDRIRAEEKAKFDAEKKRQDEERKKLDDAKRQQEIEDAEKKAAHVAKMKERMVILNGFGGEIYGLDDVKGMSDEIFERNLAKERRDRAGRDEAEKKRKEEQAAAEAAKLEAMKPDKEKLRQLGNWLGTFPRPELVTQESQVVLDKAEQCIREAINILMN